MLLSKDLRVVSLIPSATEIVDFLGVGSRLVGCSHACDYPAQVQSLPICTAPNLDPHAASDQIHHQVESLLQKALSIYALDLDLIRQTQPTHIITQAQCEVCAVSFDQVAAAVQSLDSSPQLISLQPNTLDQVWQSIQTVGDALGVPSEGAIAQIHQRLSHLTAQAIEPPLTVACIEWTDPLMAAGNWVPQLVQMAGGCDVLGHAGEHSDWLTWDQLQQVNPEVLVVMPCGFDLAATQAAVATLSQDDRWFGLQAVQRQHVFLTDGNQYFNRPGPRLVDSLQILLEIFHCVHQGKNNSGRGWQRWQESQ